jgi:hypothetical protein
MKSLLCVSILALAVVIISAPAKAQDSKVSLFGGYSFGTNNVAQNDPGLHGYALSAAYNFNKHIGLEANFSGHNGSTTIFFDQPLGSSNGEKRIDGEDIYTYVFGPKFSLPVGNFSLFTHILVGGSHAHEGEATTCVQATSGPTCFTPTFTRGSGSGMAVKTGAGVDWNHGRWGIRILQVDYVHSTLYATIKCAGCETDSFDTSWSGVEMSTGVTLNFGKR